MPQKKPTSNTSSNTDNARTPKAVEVGAPVIYKGEGGTLYPLDVKEGPYLTTDSNMDDSDITVTVSVRFKHGGEAVFEDIVDKSGTSGARRIFFPLSYITSGMGHTLFFSYKGRVGGQVAESRVAEVGVRFYDEKDLEGYVPKFVHSELVNSTPTLDMHKFTGNETILAFAHPLVKAGDQLFINVAGDQDKTPFAFNIVAASRVVTPEEAVPGHVFRFSLPRGWMGRRRPWGSLTIHWGWICDGRPPLPPAEVVPTLETRLPENALEGLPRPSSRLIEDPRLENPPPPHLRQSVLFNDEWYLNPELTTRGGNVYIPDLETYADDQLCFYVSGLDYGNKPLGCVTIKHDGELATTELSPCVIACFFNTPMALTYTVQFPHSNGPQQSPERVINVLLPRFPLSGIEQATGDILDLSTFAMDATAFVPVWDYSECSNLCWMWITGERENGSAYRFDILSDAPVTEDWKVHGVDARIPREVLLQLADCSEFKLHFAASFCEATALADAHEFPAQAFNIEQEPLVLAAPKVTEAVGTDLTAWNGREGVHVEVSYTGKHPKHSISLCWERPEGTCWPLTSKPGSAVGAVIFSLPREAVIESMGKTVAITYTVTTACKVQTSLPLNVKISKPVRLPTPVVPQATPPVVQGGILDLATFSGDASITVEKWWFALAGQRVWLKCSGIRKDGNAHTFYVLKGTRLTDEQAKNGLVEWMSRHELDALRHDTPLIVTCVTALYDSELEADSIVFPTLRVIIRKPLECKTEDFESLPLERFGAGNSVQTPLMKITFQSGSGVAGIVTYGNDPFYSGKHFVMCENEGDQDPPQLHRIDFPHALESIRFAWSWKQAPATVTFYNQAGGVITKLDYDDDWRGGFWVEHVTEPGTAIAWMTILVRDYSFIDNFRMCYRV